MQKYNNRSEVPEKYRWDLTSFFKNEEEFEDTLQEAKKLVEKLPSYVGCTKDANRLYEFLNKYYEANALCEDLYVYAFLLNDQELGITSSMLLKEKAEKLSAELDKNVSFLGEELLHLSKEKYTALYDTCPSLLEYKSMLDKEYRNKEHTLKESEEVIVQELLHAMDHYEDMASHLLNKEHHYGKVKMDDGDTVEIATNNYERLMKNENVKIRKKVYLSLHKTLEQYSDTIAMYLNGYVSMCDKLAHIYHHENSWEHKLFHLNQNDKIFKALISTTMKNASLIQKYCRLKKHVLNLPILHGYDIGLELVSSSKEYSIEEAQELVRNALKPLGNDYVSRFDKIIQNRYIDYCQYKGKCSGGYSFSSTKQDSRILMSFNYNLDSVSAIAHESGHNIHHQYVMEHNTAPYLFHDTIVGEVASLTNECLLSHYLMEHGTSKEEKLAGLSNMLGVIASNLFGSVREGYIEKLMHEEVHRGGLITSKFLNEKTKELVEIYYGKEVKMDEHMYGAWITRSHYFRRFYLFDYAICISVATNVASKILEGDEDMLHRYMDFLKTGSDLWPTEVFKILGIDLEDESVYQNACDYFNTLIDKFYEIYDGKEKE